MKYGNPTLLQEENIRLEKQLENSRKEYQLHSADMEEKIRILTHDKQMMEMKLNDQARE